MLPRVSDMRAPAPLHSELTAELRLRGFEGDLAPAYGDRIVSATDNSIYQLLPAARRVSAQRRRPGAHRPCRCRAALQGHRVRTSRRRNRHQRPVADGRSRGGRLAPHEPDPRDQPGRALGARAGRRGEGPAQCRAGRTRPVLPAGTLHLQSRHDRRHDQHRRQRPGFLPLRQDARPRAGADDRAAGRHGLDVASAGGRGAAASPAANRPRRRRSQAGRRDPARAGGPDRSPFPEAEPLPHRLRPRSHPRRSRSLQPELDPLRQRRHACA